MADTRHVAVWDWLMTCPHIKDMFFNFSQSGNGDTVLVPLTTYTDLPVLEFIGGASLRQYDFTIIRFEACSFQPNDAQNIEVLCDVEQIAGWVEAQRAARNYPAFPRGCAIQGVEALPSGIASVSAQDEAGAKYMLQFRIEYIKED